MTKLYFYLFCHFLSWIVLSHANEQECDCQDPDLPSYFFTLNDAIIETLENQKQIQISILNIANQAGILQQSAGPFDTTLNQVSFARASQVGQRPPTVRYMEHKYNATTTVTKTARIGTMFTFFNEEEYIKDSIRHPLKIRESNVAFRIDQPLLRNFMYGIDAQTEKANRLELVAVEWDTLFTVSQTILDTTLAYWGVVGAKLNLAVQKEADRRLNELLEKTKILIQGSVLAPADINQVLATIATQQAATAAAEIALYVDNQSLRFAMGEIDEDRCCGFDELIAVIEEFPPLPALECVLNKVDCLINTGFNFRADLLASLTRQTVRQTLLKGAMNQTLPGMNVFGSVARIDNRQRGGIIGDPDTPPSFFRNGETDWTIGLTINIPFMNDEALGFLKQQEAKTAQSILDTQLLKQNIITNILQTVHTLKGLLPEIRATEEALHYYKILVSNETRRLSEGFGLIFVLIDFENQVTSTSSFLISLYEQFFQNIARLKFLTGTLVNIDSCSKTILYHEDIKFPFE